jgi:cysteinyl-tRNA synthetase
MALRFYNSLTHSQVEFTPLKPGQADLYTCGPTVYNYAHIGNFRAYMFEDLLRRTLSYCGYQVRQVMNLTDVDDKTIRDSKAAAIPLRKFTQTFKDAFFEDLKVLQIEPAEVYPAATDHIPEMIELVQTLMDKGFAYQADDHCVYFSINKFKNYGQLARIRLDQMRSGVRISNDEYAKESVADFALWKAWTEADGDVFWESPWGRGRPGWHIECSAMSMKYLGKTFDLHTGGIDNMFPHHEDEIAQSEAANDCKFVNYWLHCAHLMVEGEKMSKSAGNFFTLRQLLDKGYSGRVIRWVLLGTHYRQALNFTFQGCNEAQQVLRRLDDFIARVREAATRPDTAVESTQERLDQAESKFRGGLEDDLNISAALAGLFDLVRDINKQLDSEQLGGAAAEAVLTQLRQFDRVLCCLQVDRQSEEIPAEILQMDAERQAARKAKDWALADQLRDQLKASGWTVEDTPKGVRFKRN